MQQGKGYKGGISTENTGLSQSNRGVGQVSKKQLCSSEPLGIMTQAGETQFASKKSRNKRSDNSCPEKDFQQKQTTLHEIMPVRHIGSHHMRLILSDFHAKHCYYFKAGISLSELKLVDVGHADIKEIANVTCKLSTAVRGNVHNSATTVSVDEVDLVSAVKQILSGLGTSAGFLNEKYLGITALVDGRVSSQLTLQILQSIILRTLIDGAQSQTSSNVSIISEFRPCRADQPRSSALSVSSAKTLSVNSSPTAMVTSSRQTITGVQPAPFTPQTPFQFSAPKTGQVDIKRLDKSTATLQAREQHIPLNPFQTVLQVPVKIQNPSPASEVSPLDIRKRQQKPAPSSSVSTQKPNALLQIPVEMLWPTSGNISSELQNSTPFSLSASSQVSSVESSQHESMTVEHNQSVKITEDVSAHAATARGRISTENTDLSESNRSDRQVSKKQLFSSEPFGLQNSTPSSLPSSSEDSSDISTDSATEEIDVDNEIRVDVPICIDLNQVQNNIRSETSKEFLHEKLHPDNETGNNKDSDKCEISRSVVHDLPQQLPSTFHNTQDKNILESFTHYRSGISQIKEVSSDSVTAQEDSNVKPVDDPVLPVTDEWMKTNISSDSRTEMLSIAGKPKVNSVSTNIGTTFPQKYESPQRTATPIVSSDGVKRPISGASATDFPDSSTEPASITEGHFLADARAEDMECPVLGNQDSQDIGLKKASRQPIMGSSF